MAEFTLNGRLKVKTLKAQFKANFGSTLRVYKSASCKGPFADDEATLASVRAEGFKGGDFAVKGNMLVGNFEKKVADMFGIGVQVASSDDKVLVDNSLTLAASGNIECKKATDKCEMPNEPEIVEDEEDQDDDCKTLRLKISGYDFKEIAVQPVCDDEAEEILSNNGANNDVSFCDIASLNDDYGMEKIYYYFVPSYSEVMLTVFEEDEDGDESVICEEEDFEVNPEYGMMSMEDAIDNYEDDKESFESYKAFLTETGFEKNHRGCSVVANSLKKSWKGLAENEATEETFLPLAMAEAMRLSEAEKAVIRGCEMSDEFDISFYIRLPKDEEFDSSKLKFICIDTEYEDNSFVLQEHLASDMTCLNMIIYDNVMHFASEANTLLDGGYSDICGDVYDCVDTCIESLD